MKVSIVSSLFRLRSLGFAFLGACFFVGCSGKVEIPLIEPPPVTREAGKTAEDLNKQLFPPTTTPMPNYPDSKHLKECEGVSDCGDKMSCLNLGTAVCLFKCDPKQGTGTQQNPACIAPENCLELSDGSGACIFFPGQLYGSGSYTALIRHKRGDKCLLQYGGCVERHICVDTTRSGAIGTCNEECDINAKNPVCLTANTVCKRLASGVGACLPK